MTSLDKLSISGVRAYSPDAEQVIQFFHPLTIIVGSNGSGKTTIIEALRFATTGTAPETSERGKNFVHDPRVSGRASVKAKLKLGFTSTARKKVVAVKLLQVTQKAKGKREYKQLDSVLKTKDNAGNEVTISHKCSDMEKLVPSLLGVSKAILDLVIFCHQEESLWPMSDSKTLKEKFDEIFAATRYSAALARIKKLRSEKSKLLLEMQGDVAVLQTNVEHAHKLRDDAELIKAQVATRQEDIRRIDGELAATETEQTALAQKRHAASELQREIDRLEQGKALLVAEKDKTLKRIGEAGVFPETDAQLAQFMAEWKDLMVRKRTENAALDMQSRELNNRASELNRNRESLVKRVGLIEAQELAISGKRSDCDRKISELAARFSIDAASLPAPSARSSSSSSSSSSSALVWNIERPTEFLRRLNDTRRQRQSQLLSFLTESESVDQSWEKQVVECRARAGGLRGQIESKNAQVKANATRRVQLDRERAAAEAALGTHADVAERLTVAQHQYAAKAADQASQVRANEIERMDTQMRSNLQRLSLLADRVTVLQVNADAHAQIALRTQQLTESRGKLAALSSTLRAPVMAALSGGDKSEAAIAAEVTTLLPDLSGGDRDSTAATLAQSMNDAHRSHSQLSVRVSARFRQLQQAREDAERSAGRARNAEAEAEAAARVRNEACTDLERRAAALLHKIESSGTDDTPKILQLLKQTEVTTAVKKETFLQSIAKREKKVQSCKDEVDLGHAAIKLLRHYYTQADNDKACPVCDRPFPPAEAARLLGIIRSKQERLISQQADSSEPTAQLAREQARLAERQKLRPHFDEYLDIADVQMPEARKRAQHATAHLETTRAERTAIETGALASMRAAEERARVVVSQCEDLLKSSTAAVELARVLADETHKLRERTQAAEAKVAASRAAGGAAALAIGGGGREAVDVVSLDDARAQEATARQLNESLTQRLGNLRRAENEHTQQLRDLQNAVNALVERAAQHQKATASIESGKQQIAALDAATHSLSTEIATLEASGAEVERDAAQRESERKRVHAQAVAGQQQRRVAVEEVDRECNAFRALVDELGAHAAGEADRVRARNELGAVQAQVDAVNVECRDVAQKASRNAETLKNEEVYYRRLEDNIEYRQRISELQRRTHEIKELHARLAELMPEGRANALADQLARVERARAELQSRKDTFRGAIQSDQQRAAEIERDLKLEKYHQIDAKFRKKNVEFETTSMANRDLEKFYRALDKALMEFHSMKMQEINTALGELWRTTYKGTDIDEVIIRSDMNEEDGGAESVAAAGRKQYNYRVVMRSGDTELDMRGRCSAGQKVLASILIRLALAETFCADCGIIALDEPTTNLDDKNSNALALALNEIIERRRKQENFQLIVITHDEKFVDLLGKRDVADYFFRVSKDRSGFSVIHKVPMSEE